MGLRAFRKKPCSLAKARTPFALRGTQLMAHLSGLNILIVDHFSTSAVDLRARLMELGARVHVVGSVNAAMRMARTKKIHAVFIEYSLEEAARKYSQELDEMRIPCIFT